MICRTCRAPVRYGRRHERHGWWHREDLDHDAFPIPEPEVIADPVIPPIEIACHAVEPKDEIVPGGVRTITNLLAKRGWELRRLTHARGPYIGAKGEALSISDTIVLGAVGPRSLDGKVLRAVASWRDGKFDFAYALGGDSMTKVNATELRNFIKGTYDPHPAVRPPGE
jgi:hypothetical protein